MLRVYYADLSNVSDEAGDLPLSTYRLEKLRSCRSFLRRRQGIGAELLLIRSLRPFGLNPPLPLRCDPKGKPFLTGSDLYFNLSHSGNYAACVVSDMPLGVDAELEKPLHELLVKRLFSERETALLALSEEKNSVFTQIWTEKESFCKAAGMGISSELKQIDTLALPEEAKLWHTRIGKLHLSVCVLGNSAEPDVFQQIELP